MKAITSTPDGSVFHEVAQLFTSFASGHICNTSRGWLHQLCRVARMTATPLFFGFVFDLLLLLGCCCCCCCCACGCAAAVVALSGGTQGDAQSEPEPRWSAEPGRPRRPAAGRPESEARFSRRRTQARVASRAGRTISPVSRTIRRSNAPARGVERGPAPAGFSLGAATSLTTLPLHTSSAHRATIFALRNRNR